MSTTLLNYMFVLGFKIRTFKLAGLLPCGAKKKCFVAAVVSANGPLEIKEV